MELALVTSVSKLTHKTIELLNRQNHGISGCFWKSGLRQFSVFWQKCQKHNNNGTTPIDLSRMHDIYMQK